jgi:hypothetical protein
MLALVFGCFVDGPLFLGTRSWVLVPGSLFPDVVLAERFVPGALVSGALVSGALVSGALVSG